MRERDTQYKLTNNCYNYIYIYCYTAYYYMYYI